MTVSSGLARVRINGKPYRNDNTTWNVTNRKIWTVRNPVGSARYKPACVSFWKTIFRTRRRVIIASPVDRSRPAVGKTRAAASASSRCHHVYRLRRSTSCATRVRANKRRLNFAARSVAKTAVFHGAFRPTPWFTRDRGRRPVIPVHLSKSSPGGARRDDYDDESSAWSAAVRTRRIVSRANCAVHARTAITPNGRRRSFIDSCPRFIVGFFFFTRSPRYGRSAGAERAVSDPSSARASNESVIRIHVKTVVTRGRSRNRITDRSRGRRPVRKTIFSQTSRAHNNRARTRGVGGRRGNLYDSACRHVGIGAADLSSAGYWSPRRRVDGGNFSNSPRRVRRVLLAFTASLIKTDLTALAYLLNWFI